MLPKTHKFTVLFVVFLAVATAEEEKYTNVYDYVNIDEILNNEQLRNQYYACFMDIGPCVTPESKYFKRFIAEVVLSKCKKCNTKQLENINKVVVWFMENQPDKWTAFVQKAIEDLKSKI